MRRVWSKSLTLQFIVLLLLALAASQAVGAAIAWAERSAALRSTIRSEFLSRSASVAKLLETTPSELQADILKASGTNYSRFWVTPTPPDDMDAWRGDARRELTKPLPGLGRPIGSEASDEPPSGALIEAAKSSAKASWSELSATAWPLPRPARFLQIEDATTMGLAVRLQDGAWLNSVWAKPAYKPFWTPQTVATMGVTALLLCLIAIFIGRGITRPMRGMAAAAEAVGRGEQAVLPEIGPDDIRSTAQAFNLMQERLNRFVEDRTRMIAAIGHDLRTPITSLRLRAEFVSGEEVREKLLNTIDELQRTVEASLDFARQDAEKEQTRDVDLTALVESLCDDLREVGLGVDFVERTQLPYRCRPNSLRRALRNVIENAVRYGQHADVELVAEAEVVEVVVRDRGPGIPENEREKVFSPFYRLERSRNQETGGVGLGLAIARTIVRRHGGDIRFDGGAGRFHTTLSLPRIDSAPMDVASSRAAALRADDGQEDQDAAVAGLNSARAYR